MLETCAANVGEEKEQGRAGPVTPSCDVFVNDAFGTAHRAEASTHAVAKFAPVACAGVPAGRRAGRAGQGAGATWHARWWRSLAGSKVSTKLTILESLADKVDQLIMGGGIANTFLAAGGKQIGKSLYEADMVETSEIASASCAPVAAMCRCHLTYAPPNCRRTPATIKAIAARWRR